tara:strand:- start:27 stop:566 length:540 start_codon:yes stop_codon:yes gene_type:complete
MNQSQTDSVYDLTSSKFTCGFYKTKKNPTYGAKYYFNLIISNGSEFSSLTDNIRDFIVNCDIKSFKTIITETECTITTLNLVSEVITKAKQFVEKDFLLISKYEINNKSYPNREDIQDLVTELEQTIEIIRHKNTELLEKESTLLTTGLEETGENNIELENALNNTEENINIKVTQHTS